MSSRRSVGDLMDLSGSSAVVLGGASGLGLATAAMLSRRAAHVVVADVAAAGRGAVEDLGDNVTFVVADAGRSEEVRAVVTQASDRAPLGAAVATAGVVGHGRILGSSGPMSMEDFERVVRVNLLGSAALVVHAAEAMAGRVVPDGERGVIVLTGSIAALDGGNLAYAASKAGVAGMTLSAAHGLAPHGIRVLCVAPGVFRTPMFDEGGPSTEAVVHHVPFPHRLGDPEEYAALVAHILDNQMLNGEVIRLDAALRLPRLSPSQRENPRRTRCT
jgi:NAD(P)-dependent dehydrogenase (short-subunit alcohol dehydrogenase family)